MVRQADELERQFGALYNARVTAHGSVANQGSVTGADRRSRNRSDDYPLLANTTVARNTARQLERRPRRFPVRPPPRCGR